MVGSCLISYLEKQNQLTQLRLYVPKLALEIQGIQEENTLLKYRIQEFENPDYLMKIANSGSFNHLKHPLEKEILVIQGEDSIQSLCDAEKEFLSVTSKHTLVVGTR